MVAHEEISKLLKLAAASMKADIKGALANLEAAYSMAATAGDPEDTAMVAEELARGWARRKSNAKSLHFALKATKLVPERKAAWATLGKTCELVALNVERRGKNRRAQSLYRGAASAFKKAAALTKDPEDKRWLLELAADAARQAKPPKTN
jgi:hypothetical protein